MEFDPKSFEKEWQRRWEEQGLYRAANDESRPPCFVVDMFPYPSGSSMHVGHPRGYVATDVYSRFKRMKGFNVLHPMGWDAFGLPAEETAIQNKEYPAATVRRNIEKFKAQLMMLGLGYDWSREINTTDPAYYAQTQRIFLEFFRRGLARNNMMSVNWCPALGTVLANEDIVDGKSERGGHPVFQRPMRQWVLAITEYADRLVDDLALLPQWPEKVKTAQRNWIGRSEGHEFSFATTAGIPVRVFTTRIETLPGATFLVLAPEHPAVAQLRTAARNAAAVDEYVERSAQRTELDRQTVQAKTGVILEGVTATNPCSGEQILIVVADYVLASYGTGAIMAVPAHDARDAEMAEALGLPAREVVREDRLTDAAGTWHGQSVEEARMAIAAHVGAEARKRYKIRDWVFSRQRFWGEPFPIVWVEGEERYARIAAGPAGAWLPPQPVTYEQGGKRKYAVPVLPEFLSAVRLPEVESYEPTGTMEGPLAGITQWVHAYLDPATGEVSNQPGSDAWIPVERETNTMPQWAGSSWYWLRYMDPKNATEPFSKESAEYWGPVDVYAGADHAVAHLIYARFWHKVMQDAGMVDFPEPFERLEFLGYILAADGTKISKRSGNSRSPEAVVDEAGADAFRLYEMFIGPFEKAIPWSDAGLTGTRRFLERVWQFALKTLEQKAPASDARAAASIAKAVHKVGEDIEAFKFNTAVSALMTCLNQISGQDVCQADLERYLQALAPFAPHLTEELWSRMGKEDSVHRSVWPETVTIADETVSLAVQVNGKLRATLEVSRTASEEDVRRLALEDDRVRSFVGEAAPSRVIYVPGRVLNIVVK